MHNSAATAPAAAAEVLPADDPVDGFTWQAPGQVTAPLSTVVEADLTAAARRLRQHVDAFDQLLVAVADAHGELLGGARALAGDDRDVLRRIHQTVDRTVLAYVDGLRAAGTAADVLGAQVVGAAVLLGHAARHPLGLVAPPPLAGRFDEPPIGGVSGTTRFAAAGDEAWRGGHWIIETEDGRRLPAMLTTLLYDSSGVDREDVQDTHRAALRGAIDATDDAVAEIDTAATAAGAIDHLLVDWLLAHRYEDGDLAVRVDGGRIDDAWLIVDAAAASVRVRRQLDPLG